jgi:hypothetical protein
MRRFVKFGGLLLCLLTLSMLSVPIATVNAVNPKGRAMVWGSESSAANYNPPGWSWRKHPDEVDNQSMIAQYIEDVFDDNGYKADNYQGDDGSDADLILQRTSEADAKYHQVAVVDFDHGNGLDHIPGVPSSEFHYMFEDQEGTSDAPTWGSAGSTLYENAVFDYEIYPRTADGKVFFAFINTCNSAHIADYLGENYAKQGIIQYTDRARGMPYAWSHRLVIDKSTLGFTTSYHMSDDGYADADDGDFCYIGFDMGSAALSQTVEGSGHIHCEWVAAFFYYALECDESVNDALDSASLGCYNDPFDETLLCDGFNAIWPMWNSTTNEWEFPSQQGKLKVYGNGDIYLKRKGGAWDLDGNAYDDLFDNNGDVTGAQYTTGKFGSALSFDGNDDYMEVCPFDFEFTEITAEFWMKTSDTTKNGTPLSCSSGTQHNEFLLYNYRSFDIWINGGSVSTGVSANDGKWHHIALTWKKSNGHYYFYKDGAVVHMGALQAGATLDLANLILGQEQDSFGGEFDSSQAFMGEIDEVRIYDYVLSSDQIADNAAVAVYHFNGGDKAYDSSHSSRNNAEIHGASWSTGPITPLTYSMGLSFDGNDDYAVVDDDPSLDFGTGSFTFSAWVKWGGWVSGGYNRIIQKSNYPSQWWVIDIAADGAIEFESNIGTVSWWGGPLLEEDNWVHLAIVVDRENDKYLLYKNGALHDDAKDESWSGSPDSNADMFFAPDALFNGVLDDVRIYDRVLSHSEILRQYHDYTPTNAWLHVTGPNAYPYGPSIWIDSEYVGMVTASRSLSQEAHTIAVDPWFPVPP